MSSIGKNINTVFPELSRAKVVEQREYEVKWAHTDAPTGTKVREQKLDLNGDGKADLTVERNTDVKTGRFYDSFSIENSQRVQHDKVVFYADQQGVVRSEFHRDDNTNRQVNLWDANGDGKLDGKSIHFTDGSMVERDDSNGDGTIDRERSISKDGVFAQKSILTDPFFEDEN